MPHISLGHLNMGRFGSGDNPSSGGGSKFKGASSGKRHSGSDKRAPTGKFGFARLQNDDGNNESGGAGAGGRDRSSGGGQSRGGAPSGISKQNKGSKAQGTAATSVRSALKHVAVEHLVAGGAKKSKLLQKVYDCDAFTGTSPNPTLLISCRPSSLIFPL